MDEATKNLLKFWDNFYKITDEDYECFKAIDKSDYLSLAPSIKQVDALRLFKNNENIIDYGCGTGWASIIMAMENINNIKAVDLSPNSIKAAQLFSNAYGVNDKIEAFIIDENWLKKQNDKSYNGFFSSNVIDVIPLKTSLDIIKEVSRIIKDDSYVIFSLNYYISIDEMKRRKWEIKDKSAYIDGILRLTSLSDDEWIIIFKKYFKVIDVIHYAWKEEETEKRRLFILKTNKL